MHIFISYAKKDTRALALLLRDRLRALPGVTAWMDDSLEAGSSWATQIQDEIDRSDYVVVLLSPDVNRPASTGRSFVLNEIDYAQANQKPIIPVMAQTTRIPVQIAGIQYIDFTADQDAGIERLLRRVQGSQRGAPSSDDSTVGRHPNYGTPPPMSPRPQNMPLPPSSASGRKPVRTELIVAVISGLFLVIAGVIAIIPQLQQNQLAQQAVDATATAAQIAVIPTAAALTQTPPVSPAPTLAPSDTPASSSTPVQPTDTSIPPTSADAPPTIPQAAPVTTSGLAIGTQAEVRSSNEAGRYLNIHTGIAQGDSVIQQVPTGTTVTIVDGPLASQGRIWWKVRTPDGVEGWAIEASATRQTLVPIEQTATLRLIASPDSLTLVVTSPTALNLNGLELQVLDTVEGRVEIEITDWFDILALTEGIAEPGTCFVYQLSGANQPLPSACNQPNRVFRRDVPRADVFWYDFTANRQRDVAVLRDGSLVTLCAAVATECPVSWLNQPTLPPSATNTGTPRITQVASSLPAMTAPTGVSTDMLRVGMSVIVQVSSGSSLNMRSGPDTRFGVLERVYSGAVVTLLEGPVTADGYEWWKIDRRGNQGWVVAAVENEPVLVPVAAAPTATAASAAKGYPCEAKIEFYSSAPLNVVHVSPIRSSSLRAPVQQGASIVILDRAQETLNQYWYHIEDTSGNELGWITVEHVVPSANCPN